MASINRDQSGNLHVRFWFGEPQFRPLAEAEAFLVPLESIDWVAYTEPPPTDDCSPEHVVKYLGR